MRYIKITCSTELPDISRFAPFKAIIAVEDPVSEQRQSEISAWIVQMGCRYVMSIGESCDSWRDSVRRANLKSFNLGTLTARDFVMVTSHANESLKSVFWYAKNFAKHPEVVFKDAIVFHIANIDRSAEYERIYERA